MSKLNIFIIIAISWLTLTLAQDEPWQPPEIKPMLVGVDYSLSLNRGEVAYFQYIADSIGQNKDLSFIAAPLHFGDDPDIFVALNNNTYPNSTGNADYYSTAWGFDLLTIPTNKLSINQTVYIGFKCSSLKCEFIARIQFTSEFYMPANAEVQMSWLDKASQILRIAVPDDPLKQIEHIVIYAELNNAIALNSGFHMYIKKGNEIPSSTNHDISAKEAWFDGKAAVLYAGDASFCTGCNYTVIIEAQNSSMIIAGLKTYGNLLNMTLDKYTYDAVNFHKNVTYTLNISEILNDPNSSLNIEFVPYFGQAIQLLKI